jgi:hypothetical protein
MVKFWEFGRRVYIAVAVIIMAALIYKFLG